MIVQLQYFRLITDKTNAADMSSGAFTILISVTRTFANGVFSKVMCYKHNASASIKLCNLTQKVGQNHRQKCKMSGKNCTKCKFQKQCKMSGKKTVQNADFKN